MVFFLRIFEEVTIIIYDTKTKYISYIFVICI